MPGDLTGAELSPPTWSRASLIHQFGRMRAPLVCFLRY
jgi:hypothetical protein